MASSSGPGDRRSIAPRSGPEEDARLVVQILAFNDFHGHLEPPSGGAGRVLTEHRPRDEDVFVRAGGAAFLAHHLANARANYPHTIVVSAGDLIGASPLVSALFHDEPTIVAMNRIGLDLSAVGNHEFDEGVEELLRMQRGGCHPVDGCRAGPVFPGARFSFLAANVVVDGGSETLFPRYQLREFESVPVAFIGMTLEGTGDIVSPHGISNISFRDEVETVNHLVPELRGLGAETIVVLVHEGGYQGGLYDECRGISGPIVHIAEALDPAVDVIISGHTHEAYNCEIAGKRVTSALSFGRLFTRIVVQIDRRSHDVISIDARNSVVTQDVPLDSTVAELVDGYVERVAPLRDRVIGHVKEPLFGPRHAAARRSGESELGDFIADAHLFATRERSGGGAQIAFINPGGIRSDLEAGPVTFGQVFSVQPFGNDLVVMSLTGAEIASLLEQQFQPNARRILQPSVGFSYAWRATGKLGAMVVPGSIRLQGRALDPNVRYRVAVNRFLASGGDGFTVLTKGLDRHTSLSDIEALERWIGAKSPVEPPELGRITVVQ